MKNKEDNTGGHDPAQIRSQAEQKARAIKSPDLEFMTCEEIGQMFHEMQAKQLKMEMQVRHLQSMLKESEDQKEILTTITENMLDLVSLADIEGNLIFLGKSHDIFGYELKSLQAKNVMDFVHPEDLSRVLEAYKELVTSGAPSRIEYRCRCKDGSYLWIETRGTFFRDENNNPQGIVFSSRDITKRRIAEQKLRESKEEAVQKERLYRLLFEQSPLGVFHVDENGFIVSCNDNFVKIIGSSRKALVGLDMKKLPDQKLVKELRKALAGSHAFYKDTYHSVTAKKSTPVKVYFSPLITEDAALIGCTGIVEDITERKQAEEAVRQSEALHSKMVANIGEVIVIIDENGINRYKSGNVEKHFGWKPEELVGALTWENVHPDDLPPVRRLFADIIQSPGKVGAIECRYRCKDGTYKWIEFTGSNLLDDPDIHGLLGNYKDISERKKAEQALLESEQTFRALFEKGPNGVAYHSMVYDKLGEPVNYRFLAANQSYQKLTGVDPTGKLVTEAFPGIENDPFDWIGTFGKVAKTGQEIRFQQHLQPNDRWYDCVGYQYKPDHFVAAFFEITEQKRAEAEQEKLQAQLNQALKMESVGRLAGGVAHDFNNKLAIINGYAEMAMDVIDPADPLFETVQEIHTAGNQSADIVRQLLAFARKQTISPVLIDLNDTISGMLKMLHRLIGENIDLAWHPGKNLWSVKIDPSQVDQIMANLAVNSRDAISDVGKLIIETKNTTIDEYYCKTNLEASPGRYVMLAVSDNGCGMEKQVQDLLFEPFFTTKEIGKGTGLGLPTIYGIVKQNKGFINLYSEPGAGTTFKLYFPSHKEDKSFLHSAKESAGQIPTGTETILVVEDEKTILQMSKQMLQRLGYSVETAGSAAEALQISKKHDRTIHLLITDVIMPDMNGRDLSSHLIQVHPGIKTLYMSGYTADVIAHHGVLDEGVKFIQKPFSLKDMAVKVREVLKQE